MSVISGKVALSYSLSPLLVANKILLLALNIVNETPELFLFNLTWQHKTMTLNICFLIGVCSAKVNTIIPPSNPDIDIDTEL